jgi:hypothetical protein
VSSLARRAWAVLDGESVRPYQAAVYAACIAAGVQGLIQRVPPDAVTQAMGHDVSIAWSVLLVLCPATTLAGVWLSRRGVPFGLWAQIAGDSGVAFTAAAYALAILQASWGRNASFAAWLAMAIAACALAMLLRDVRRVRQAERRVKRVEAASAE